MSTTNQQLGLGLESTLDTIASGNTAHATQGQQQHSNLPEEDPQTRKRRLEAMKRKAEGQGEGLSEYGREAQPSSGGDNRHEIGSAGAGKPLSPLGVIPPLTAQTPDLVTRSSSPGLPSAASSLIFERNVQEPTLSADIAPAIPAHIKTEDQIPPALEASSLAITDNDLGPEEVEIVTHTSHQPAASIIAESIHSAHPSETHLPLSPQSHHEPTLAPTSEADDTASNYGALDPNDVRRLSFISFADVVHGEHVETNPAQSLHHVPLPSSASDFGLSQSPGANQPVSPTRSPLSSYSQPYNPDATTPPTTASGPGSAKGVELSPVASQTASPSTQHGELSIETLGQALRKTASRDLSAFKRSPPSSAI